MNKKAQKTFYIYSKSRKYMFSVTSKSKEKVMILLSTIIDPEQIISETPPNIQHKLTERYTTHHK